MVELPLIADLKVEIEEYGATTRVGENLQSAIDVLEYQAARIAALEAQLAERMKANRETVAKHVYDAMSWAAVLGPEPATGTVPQWVDGGNSLGQGEARKTADAILSALEATPPAPKVTDEIATKVGDAIADTAEIDFNGMIVNRKEVALAALTAAQEAGKP